MEVRKFLQSVEWIMEIGLNYSATGYYVHNNLSMFM